MSRRSFSSACRLRPFIYHFHADLHHVYETNVRGGVRLHVVQDRTHASSADIAHRFLVACILFYVE